MPEDCCKATWAKIPGDEPVFILRGKDLLAAPIVQAWIDDAEKVGVNEDKVRRAKEHLNAIEEFQVSHSDRCKIPD